MDLVFAMRTFQRVAATLSFTEAGELLGLAGSSVSRQVDALEEHLGVKLLTRTTRKLALTEAGQAYRESVDALLADIDTAHEAIASFGDEPRGHLKVSAPRVFGKRLLTPLVSGFVQTHPKVTLELSLTDDFVDLVATDTDLGIRIGELGDSSLVSRPLGRYRRVLCCSPPYLFTRKVPRTPQELLEHSCLRYRRTGERTLWSFVGPDGGEALEVAPQGPLLANDVEVLMDAAKAGLGIALLPHWLVRDALSAGELVQVLPDYPASSTLQAAGMHFVYTINRRQSRKVHAFMDHVLQHVGPLLT
jgi:DNA-binding transcriptional LysR family regulator